jgi:predicted transcriptional regulator
MGIYKHSIADALFTKTQRAVIGLLFRAPERSFYVNEIVRLAATGTGAVQRELEKLVESGLVSVSKVGNQKHYQANPESPIFMELRGIVAKTLHHL